MAGMSSVTKQSAVPWPAPQQQAMPAASLPQAYQCGPATCLACRTSCRACHLQAVRPTICAEQAAGLLDAVRDVGHSCMGAVAEGEDSGGCTLQEKVASGPNTTNALPFRTQHARLPVLTQAPVQACPGLQLVSWAERQSCADVPAGIPVKVNATQPAVASHAAAAWRVLMSKSAPPML